MQQRREEDVFCYLGKSAIIFEYFSISNNIFFLRKTFSLQNVNRNKTFNDDEQFFLMSKV